MDVLNQVHTGGFFWRRLWRVVACLSCAASLGLLFLASAMAQPTTAEYKLKAVYLYNFVQYVDWPTNVFADAQSPLIIGVLGNDPFGNVLDETVANEVVKTRTLAVRRFKSVKEIKECHVLFVGASEKEKLRSILAALKGRSILTVSDLEDFANKGGMIRFKTDNNKIRLKINLGATRESDLSVSSKLLQLADIVATEDRPR